MRAARSTIIALVAGFGLVTAACSGNGQQSTPPATTTPTTTGSAAPDPQKVGFANDLCGAVAKFIVPAAGYRPDTSSPAAAVNSLKTQLTTLSNGLTEATQDLNDVDTAGVPDGQAAVDDLKTTFGQMKQSVDRSKARLDATDVNNQQAVAAAVQDVTKEMSSLGSVKNPLDQPALNSAEMQAAAERADECQKIQQVIAGRSTGSVTATTR
ncbi:hypothetical protein KIPE111705_26190 [Kibdelosporangium persicum]|uniref:PEP-utilizing enzyme, N-terminal n=1 Tax=Kibdelosporangium persicum TaxID=2698649 RepID=A0ABX2F2H3_9PSEU|nr:hypothetical protein [Kibdelosporangium persicum]NRN65502.1 PEP-utilizing enzyme, N-terminal [Kibdelosporangium persicum]